MALLHPIFYILSLLRNQKGKRRGTQQTGGPGAKKGHDTKDKKPEKSSDKLTPGRTTGASQAQPIDTRTGAPSVISERSDSSDVIDEKKRLSIAKATKHPRQSSALIHPMMMVPHTEESKPPSEEEEREKEVAKRYRIFFSPHGKVMFLEAHSCMTPASVHCGYKFAHGINGPHACLLRLF